MERKRVSASRIRSVGYDAGKPALLMSSPSPGSFYQDQIEENFSSRKIR